jgi:KipI family sensor histidine kinase inhibitor
MPDFRIVSAGDSAWVVEWPARIDPAVSGRAIAFAQGARHLDSSVREVVVGYCTATVYYDPLLADGQHLESQLRTLAADLPDRCEIPGAGIDVDVCYGGDLGPDLGDVAAHAGMSEADVIALHSDRVYRVYVVGFIPGFPYMAAVDDRLALPRRANPRLRVPSGSVAIAAGQTGIYPRETPGGWHLIGRTKVRPYDPSRTNPFLFAPGDRVRFHPIDRAQFEGSL